MRTGKVIAMFGLSGVGKGWLARQLCERRPEILHLEASALMRDVLKTSSEALRTATVGELEDNQQKLISAFTAARAANPNRPVLFDGHSVIDNDVGLLEISVSVIAALNPQHIVFVSDQVSVIARRRQSDARKRPTRTLDELSCHQAHARSSALIYASSLAVPFSEVQSDDWMTLDRLFGGGSN